MPVPGCLLALFKPRAPSLHTCPSTAVNTAVADLRRIGGRRRRVAAAAPLLPLWGHRNPVKARPEPARRAPHGQRGPTFARYVDLQTLNAMPCGKKRKRHKIATHKRKKRLRKNRHKKKGR